jgi:RNA polymerase sigma factor (sigma-70 family)
MFQKKEDGISVNARPNYTVPGDFCRIFAEDETGLYLLSLLLTADSEKAEQCFVAGLDDSIRGNPVFKEWARSWSKRMIIKNAIRIVAPAQGRITAPRQIAPTLIKDTQHVSDQKVLASEFGHSLTAVLQLAPLERLVFVMSVLERYSIQECSILLNFSKQQVAKSLARALQQMSLADIKRTAVAQDTQGIRAPHFLEPMQAS